MTRLILRLGGLLCAASTASALSPGAVADTVQVPGPSAALFAAPYYQCLTNYFVATTGSDANAGTFAAPWATLQRANNSGKLQAGACVNVAPGTYAGVVLSAAGNAASAAGYVTWRCTTMDACTVNTTAGVNGNAGFFAAGTGTANYTIIDGFTVRGTGAVYNVGIEITGSTNGGVGTFGSHHVWVLNSVISGNGQAGIAFANGDYTYAFHNRIYSNASAPSCDNGAQGSGLADNVALDIAWQYPGYVATADDKVNPNPLIGSFVTNSSWFHKAYEWNVVYNNYISPCTGSTTADTDGNNIIIDTFGTGNGNSTDYPDQTLIAFNVTYNAGGGGIHVFFSENVTVSNNTCYNNFLDPNDQGAARACIDTNDSYGNTIQNNIAVAIPAAPGNGRCAFAVPPYAQFNSAMLGGVIAGKTPNVFRHNVTQLQGGNHSCWGFFGANPPTGENPMFNGDAYSCSSNKCATDPLWVDVGTSSVGTQSTPPAGVNFALQPGSPAIGYGTTETYLSPQSVDAGACFHSLGTCP